LPKLFVTQDFPQLRDAQLQFSVSDTGVGLPAEKMDQIYSAFLTIVESHGGQLWASANGGGGETFHFPLPTQMTESSPLDA
jgi:signal transduction histidine kinase